MMVRHEEEDETMRVCGCHAGRPCTCEMGEQTASTTTFVCGVCVNCRLNAREGSRARRRSSILRRCLKSAEHLAELAFDRVILRGNCVLRMRKPDWNVDEKTPMYNKLHQMRLAMIQTHAMSLATIDVQKKLRIKYSNELRKAEDAIKKLDGVENETALKARKMTQEQLCVDSDVFDSFSKPLIAPETLLPDLKTRLNKVNAIISTEQANIKSIREYVRDFAVRKLQSTTRAFFRFRKWKDTLNTFQEDVRLSAALEIQATWRMFVAKQERLFLAQLHLDTAKANAAEVLQRFFFVVATAKRRKRMVSNKEAEVGITARQLKSFHTLFAILGRAVLRNALARWTEENHAARTRALRKTLASAILIQRLYRGFRDRIYLKRIKLRSSLTDRVRTLFDQFIVSGNLWGFIMEIDADYRRYMHKIEEEEADATTFMSTVLHQRKLADDKMMRDWFTASALENPLVGGIDRISKTYSSEAGNSSGNSASQAMLQSALVEDLIALSPNKRKDELFPPDFPPNVIRQSMAKGFSLDEVIAVMRGLQVQRKDIEDADLVLTTLQKRSPLMTNSWKSERVVREFQSSRKTITHRIPVVKPDESIPGGMNAPIARLLLVAALRCYDPGNRCQKGNFVPCDDRQSELIQTYLRTESPLIKIRSEQQAMEAVKPFLHTLLENRCYTAYDILYNVRGVKELISWNIPSPLAKSIYSVIQEIHVQSTHMSKHNIIREARVNADFENFIKARARQQEETFTSGVEQVAENGEARVEDSLIQVQSRLESDVLGLPLQNASLSPSELLFKAAFLVDRDANDPKTGTYKDFLLGLLTLQAAGNTEAMKQLISARVARAKTISEEHLQIFRLFGIATASDLMKDNHVQLLIRDQALQQKVTELLEMFATSSVETLLPLPAQNYINTKTTKHAGLCNLSPLVRHDKTAIDSFSESSASAEFSGKSPASSQ